MSVLPKLILYFFFREPKLQLISAVGPSPNNKKLFLQLSKWDDELLSKPKNYNISSKIITKIPRTFSIKCYSIAAINSFIFITIFLFFSVKLSSRLFGQASKS